MAKKKQSRKRRAHQFKPPSTPKVQMVPASEPTDVASAVKEKSRLDGNLLGDLKKFSLLAGLFILLELVIWYLFSYTAIGTQVYNLIKL